MNTGLGQQDLTGCATSEDLAQLLEEAFSSWHTEPRNLLECRETPRIPSRDFKPILLVSYAFDGPDVALNLPATIMDVSADGLGIILAQPLPVGAVACFTFNSQGGERHYDVAVVVRSAKCENGYSIGLTFTGDAHSLDVESVSDDGHPTPPTFRVAWPGLRWLSDASVVAYRTLTQRNVSHRTVDMDVYGRKAKLVIDVKLFRYTAHLCVDGESIVRRSGVLRDRLRGLVSDEAVPTLIHLEGGA